MFVCCIVSNRGCDKLWWESWWPDGRIQDEEPHPQESAGKQNLAMSVLVIIKFVMWCHGLNKKILPSSDWVPCWFNCAITSLPASIKSSTHMKRRECFISVFTRSIPLAYLSWRYLTSKLPCRWSIRRGRGNNMECCCSLQLSSLIFLKPWDSKIKLNHHVHTYRGKWHHKQHTHTVEQPAGQSVNQTVGSTTKSARCPSRCWSVPPQTLKLPTSGITSEGLENDCFDRTYETLAKTLKQVTSKEIQNTA